MYIYYFIDGQSDNLFLKNFEVAPLMFDVTPNLSLVNINYQHLDSSDNISRFGNY